MLDLVIQNGRIIDGTGNPWFFGDIGVKDGTIVEVGRVQQKGRQRIDACGQVIAPGFIDGHCHSDLMILDHPHSEIKLQHEFTTELMGNCGLVPAPFVREHGELLRSYVEPVLGKTDWDWPWETVGQYMDYVKQHHPSDNLATYVAHGALRIAVMVFADRPASPKEIAGMKKLLEEGLKDGGIGLSI